MRSATRCDRTNVKRSARKATRKSQRHSDRECDDFLRDMVERAMMEYQGYDMTLAADIAYDADLVGY